MADLVDSNVVNVPFGNRVGLRRSNPHPLGSGLRRTADNVGPSNRASWRLTVKLLNSRRYIPTEGLHCPDSELVTKQHFS